MVKNFYHRLLIFTLNFINKNLNVNKNIKQFFKKHCDKIRLDKTYLKIFFSKI